MHEYRWRKHGDPGTVVRMRGQPDDARFWTKVEKTPECWLWKGCTDQCGYGKFYAYGKSTLAHRFSYRLAHGSVPQDAEIDHLCRNRACVRPDHLEAVSHRVNSLRGEAFCATNARKTHCIHGHAFTADNVYIRKGGHRACATCCRESTRRYWARKKASRQP